MIRDTHTDMAIEVTDFHGQRALISHMVTELESGRTGILIMSDLPALTRILGTLDEINDQNNLDGANDFSHLDEYEDREDFTGPDCPGCVNPGSLCDDCEYPNN